MIIPTSEKIRAVRHRLGETRVEFAARFGVTPTTIYRWEKQSVPAHRPTQMVIEQLLRKMKVE